jgi:phosphoribosyl-ATP pyrophosphohydrolase
MKRRDALSRVALLMGGALSAPTIMAFLEGCTTATESSKLAFPFSADQKNLLSEIAEIIIPKTDTPGAKDAKVGEFIEMMIQDCYPEKDQKSFTSGLLELEKNNFLKASPEEQVNILTALEKTGNEMIKKSGDDKKKYTEAGKEYTDAGVPFFRLMKELTLLGYFTSEVGATQALEYVPVPGRYDGCVDLTPGQKAWAM